MKRYSWLAVLIIAIIVLVAACAPAPTAVPVSPTNPPAAPQPPPATKAPAITRGGIMRYGLDSDLTTMDPHMSTAAVDRRVYQSIYNPLVRLDKDLTLKPELAEKFEFTDPTTLVLTLRKGVKFQDGTDFNAKAVKINFDRMLNPDTKSPRASDIATVKEATVVDDYTVKITLKNPDAALLAQLSDRAGMIISPAAIDKYGKDLARNPVGTGPFKFVEWVTGDHLSVTKFDGYWEKGEDGQALPYLDGVNYKPVTDATVRLSSLKTNTLDFLQAIAAKDVDAMRKQKEFVYSEVADLGYQGYSLNNKKPPFDKLEARQAFSMAIDRDSLVKDVLFGTGTAGQGPIAPNSWAYDASVNLFKRDTAAAKALLQKAGFTLPVKFSCYVTNSPDGIVFGQAVKDQLAEAGFQMDIELLEFGTALAKYNNFEHTCFQVGWSGRPDPDGNTYGFLHSKGGLNRDQYANAKVDEALDKARAVYDQAERKKLYTDALKLAVNEVAIVYLYWPLNVKVYSPRVNNYVHVPDGMDRFKSVWLAKGTQ
ncbi:MAG: peptide ABC transporter substrate-binding protein [Chloroflexi bacterium]|nr:peptide ABC transporter substrate-binding protein [Chloroflexota bacterium]MBI3740789.1 peptide ABC transporter substrate-binding protein [Chloroflexota bacterium]